MLNEEVFFSFKRCLIEWRKQKYIKKDKSGWKKIKQKNKIKMSTMCPYSFFLKHLKIYKINKGIKKKDKYVKISVRNSQYSLDTFKK